MRRVVWVPDVVTWTLKAIIFIMCGNLHSKPMRVDKAERTLFNKMSRFYCFYSDLDSYLDAPITCLGYFIYFQLRFSVDNTELLMHTETAPPLPLSPMIKDQRMYMSYVG